MAHPRSGTVYMSRLFTEAFGVEVGDETRMGKDGISSFLIGAVDNPRWGPDPWDYDFENRIHLVRNPLKVVSSVLACVTEGVQEYMARECGVDPELPAPHRCLLVYREWNKRIEIRKPNIRMKVEDAPEHLAKWLDREPDASKLPPTDTNSRSSQLGGMKDPPDFTMNYFQNNVPLAVFFHFEDAFKAYGYSR